MLNEKDNMGCWVEIGISMLHDDSLMLKQIVRIILTL